MKEGESAKWFDRLRSSVELWELEELSDPTMREDAFARDLTFGTGGIRARMGVGPNRLNWITVARATQGLAHFLLASCNSVPKVVIAYDTRIHSREFAEVTARTLIAAGIKVCLFKEPQPTPALSFAVRFLKADAGIVITASHNPMEYNGYKVYGPTGCQATDALAHALQAEIELIDPFSVAFDSRNDITTNEAFSWVPDRVYRCYLNAVFSQTTGVVCRDIRVAYSPLNGTGLHSALHILQKLGVSYFVVEEQANPDGAFPTCPKPNPELSEAMFLVMNSAYTNKCDIAIANDPDADRIGVSVLHEGQMAMLNGNEVGLLLLDFLCQTSCSNNRLLAITTIVSSPLFSEIARAHQIGLRRTLTGFKYIGEQLDRLLAHEQNSTFLLGLEESCGYLCGEYARDKDGIVALMLVCELAAWHKSQGRDLVEALFELYRRYGYVVGEQLSVELPGSEGRIRIAEIMEGLRTNPPARLGNLKLLGVVDYKNEVKMPGDNEQILPSSNVIELLLSDHCKVIVRPSGTEPKAKAYCFVRGGSYRDAQSRLITLCDATKTLLKVGTKRYARAGSTNVILLSGGSGVGLWPLSNGSRSKQFLKVLRSEDGKPESMVQRTARLVRQENPDAFITVATSAAQLEMLGMQMDGPYSLSVEPERRDTASAIMLACAHVAWEQESNLDSTIVVLPIDTYADSSYYSYVAKLDQEVRTGAANLVLVGAVPSFPSDKYGYIVPVRDGESDGLAMPVKRFMEKPSESDAKSLIQQGAFWNCGAFAFRLGWMLELISQYCDARSYAELRARYSELPQNSFDREVVEHADSVVVLPFEGTWKDLGTWSELCEELANPISGKVWLDARTTNSVHVVNETNEPVVVAGLSHAVVAVTPDGILISGKEQSAQIKEIVMEAAADRPMYERKRWGEYRIVSEGDYRDGSQTLTRELVITPGCQLPYKKHSYRTEIWVVTSGAGKVVINGKIQSLYVGDSVRIASGEAHAAYADSELHILEVQVGWPLSQDDAELLGTYWIQD